MTIKKYALLSAAIIFCASNLFASDTRSGSAGFANDANEFASRLKISSAADFDGDGKKDLIERVTLKNSITKLPRAVKVVSPWDTFGESKNGSQSKLLVSLANSQQILIHDVNDISILDTEAATEIYIASLAELELPELSPRATGDIIVVPTESGMDVYLYWDGLTFQSYEFLDSP